MIANCIAALGRWGAQRRQSRLARRLDAYCVRFHEAYENRDYELDRNGEHRVLMKLSRVLRPAAIFDVGANAGEWTRRAAMAAPQARIESFEIVGATHSQLRRHCADLPNVHTHAIGLADAAGEVRVFHAPGRSILATCVAGITESYHGVQPQTETALVTTGDLFCAEHGIDAIDFLKIDVEGFEWRVLCGFAGMLHTNRIKAIQFEYGYVNVAVKTLLKDFYDLLGPLGFRIGKIYPRTVDFRDYQYQHEDFIGPNFLAVHSSQHALIEAVAREHG